MKFVLTCFILIAVSSCLAQNAIRSNSIDVYGYYGSILEHDSDVGHLITGHPTGFSLSYNKKTFGEKEWHSRFGYPDYGLTFIYQDMKNEFLGDNYGLLAHMNFYFFRRHLMLKIAQGIAYNTNPFDRVSNFQNNVYGSRLLSNTNLLLNYKQRIYKGLGLQFGTGLIHYSNANIKAPNTSTNTIIINAGFSYDFNYQNDWQYIKAEEAKDYKETLHYNLVLRGGINESDVVGMGQFPIFVGSFYVDKRLGRFSGLQFGVDAFISKFLKEFIYYKSVAFPNDDIKGDEDYKRAGIFLGHELYVNKLSLLTQVGYYVYYPFDFEGRIYNRIGLKYYLSNRLFAALTLKSHGARAECLEFGMGVRL
ncbi:acyloxyacyl hydrolase [Aegicerativicinus sediminis]|uniref:acyloxyacyl hydrolase n=1 Tax=Aegicerativicinus sediminis TaxID=2893202 RepID=UPI001E29949A|nr:acyloxyacyl hydrolase [Aegicerativicinus sediminis]